MGEWKGDLCTKKRRQEGMERADKLPRSHHRSKWIERHAKPSPPPLSIPPCLPPETCRNHFSALCTTCCETLPPWQLCILYTPACRLILALPDSLCGGTWRVGREDGRQRGRVGERKRCGSREGLGDYVSLTGLGKRRVGLPQGP